MSASKAEQYDLFALYTGQLYTNLLPWDALD